MTLVQRWTKSRGQLRLRGGNDEMIFFFIIQDQFLSVPAVEASKLLLLYKSLYD